MKKRILAVIMAVCVSMTALPADVRAAEDSAVQTELLPVVKPLKVCIRFAEEFQFHLFELSGTECKVTRCDLVTE